MKKISILTEFKSLVFGNEVLVKEQFIFEIMNLQLNCWITYGGKLLLID